MSDDNSGIVYGPDGSVTICVPPAEGKGIDPFASSVTAGETQKEI